MSDAVPQLVVVQPREHAHARLVAFPHAGGWASAYHEWELPAEIELWAVQAPGRGPRHAEPACTSLDLYVDGVVRALHPLLETGIPFAFFGHSFGAIAAAEVTLRLVERRLTAPLVLLLSAHPAPGVPLDTAQATMSQLETDAQLLEALQIWGFAPEALGSTDEDAALLTLTMPPIRTDLALRERYCATRAMDARAGRPPMPRLPVPLHIFGGETDRSVALENLLAWEQFAPASTAVPPAFSCTLCPGGHSYADAAAGRTLLITHVARIVAAALSTLPPSIVCGPPPPSPSGLTYAHEMVEEWAARTPHATALVDAAGAHTYAELLASATLIGAWLVGEGARPGAAVALLMGHCAGLLLAQLAIALSGAACFGAEAHFSPTVLAALVADISPVAAIACSAHAPRLAAALASSAHLLAVDERGRWREACASAALRTPPRAAWPRAQHYDTGLIMLTSGTSRRPKAIACPAVALAVAVRARERVLPYAAGTREVEAMNVMFLWEAIRPLCFGHCASRRGVLDASMPTEWALLRTTSAMACVNRCDTAESAHIVRLAALMQHGMPPLRGVWHAAGVTADALLVNQQAAGLCRVYGPKVIGASLLQRACTVTASCPHTTHHVLTPLSERISALRLNGGAPPADYDGTENVKVHIALLPKTTCDLTADAHQWSDAHCFPNTAAARSPLGGATCCYSRRASTDRTRGCKLAASPPRRWINSRTARQICRWPGLRFLISCG